MAVGGLSDNPDRLFRLFSAVSVARMSDKNTVTFYLYPKLRRQAEAGQHNFIAKIERVLTNAGLRVVFDDGDAAARLRAIARPGRSMHLMEDPPTPRGLTFRRTYLYPFWHIEQHGKRWEWPVAQDVFDPLAQDADEVARFYQFWQKRLFDDAPAAATRDGFVYVPMQGRLTTRRSFQSCSPIEMVKAVRHHDPLREIVITLHPSETYTTEEHKALDDLLARDSRLSVRSGGMVQYLKGCDYIVTQNSSAGFMGYFFGKPLILFGRADFHHIALDVSVAGAAAAFASVATHRPDFGSYLYWFLQQKAINAGRPEAEEKIQSVLRGHGWPV